MDELFNIVEEKLHKSRAVYVEGGAIMFRDDPAYYIEMRDCDTYEKVLHWVLQISPKSWATTELLDQFIVVAVAESGIGYPNITNCDRPDGKFEAFLLNLKIDSYKTDNEYFAGMVELFFHKAARCSVDDGIDAKTVAAFLCQSAIDVSESKGKMTFEEASNEVIKIGMHYATMADELKPKRRN